jgi:crotonobetainyl-CoA hydratase
MTPVVLSERHGHTVVLTINRPEARNAVDLAVSVALGDALEAADRDPEIRAIVLTGAGRLSFCAGADLKAVARGEPVKPADGPRAAWGFAGWVSHPVATPTIAAVNGFALGGGTELVLASDLAVASQEASFGLPEVRRGLIAAAGGVFRLPDQVPRKLAMELILTGEPVPAARALEMGLVNRVVPAEEVLPAALELAERIGRNAPLAVRASKTIALGLDPDGVPGEAAAWERSLRLAAEMLRTEDTREGLAAFAEKRAPVWRAR